MNEDEPNSSPDPNPYWDSAEPECRWAPQCHRLLIPGGCDDCLCLRDDILRDEDGDPIAIPDEPPELAN